jgi:hypothetical protein
VDNTGSSIATDQLSVMNTTAPYQTTALVWGTSASGLTAGSHTIDVYVENNNLVQPTNPTGVDFCFTVTQTLIPVTTTWCSPGFWKNHEELWTAFLGVKYNTIGSWRAPLGNKAPDGYSPTLQEVVENPQIYGGPATNSVADYLSNKFFGTPIGSGVESCPDPSSIQLPRA